MVMENLMPEQEKVKLEPLTAWMMRERRDFIAKSSLAVRALVVEFLGMGGCWKSTLINELVTKYFYPFGIELVTYEEPDKKIPEVSREREPKKFRIATYRRTLANLDEALGSVKDLALFDRGLFDFIVWFNLDFTGGLLSEEECRRGIADIMLRGYGKVDLMFVHTDQVASCLKSTPSMGSTSLMDSFYLSRRNAGERQIRFQLYQRMYQEMFLGDEKKLVKKAVKFMFDMNLGKFNRNFAEVFWQAVVLIDLYLVFQTWESLFLDRFGDELKQNERTSDLEKRIMKLGEALFSSLEHLRRIKVYELHADIVKILDSYAQTEFVIARCDGWRVVVSDIFGSPPKFRILEG